MAKQSPVTETEHNGPIMSRLATVETRVEALHYSIDSLNTSVESLTKQIASIGRMNWPLLVASIGVLATWSGVIAFLGRMAIAPVQVEIAHLQEQVKQHQADGHPHTVVGRIDALGSRTNERFAEVETQIRSLRETLHANQARFRELVELKSRLAIYESRHGSLRKDASP